MGGLGQDSSIFFPRFLTNANISLLAFIPQDWKYNFMITSLLEPCLIIPNYEARHLVRSVNPTVQPEQQLACCSVCVQSPWYHRWACFPILAGYNAGTYAVVLIIQHAIVQEGVYSISPASAFFSNLLRSLPKHGAWSISGPACGSWGQLALIEGEKTKPKKKAFFKRWLQVSSERSVCAHISLTLYSDLHKHKQSEELKKDVDIII